MRVIEHAIESPKGLIWGELALPDAATEKDASASAGDASGASADSDSGSSPLPLVIYSHGFNSSGERGLRFAEAITQAGFALYCFDFRGGSVTSKSAGSTLGMSVETERADLAEVIDSLAADPRFDERNVFLFGASFGGLVSALAAARAPEKIRGLALHYPAFCIPGNVHERYASLDDIPATSFELSMDVGRIFAEDAWNLDPYTEIGAFTSDVLITHGTADPLVAPSYSQRAAKTYAHAELHLIEGAGHGFYDDALTEATDYLVSYLKRHRT